MSQAFDKYEKLGAYHYDWYDDPNYAWYKKCVDKIVDFCSGALVDLGGGDGLLAQKYVSINDNTCIIIENDKTAKKIITDNLLNEVTALIDFNLDIVDNFRLPNTLFNGIDTNIEIEYDYLSSLNVIEHLKSPQSHINFIRKANKGAIIITDMPTENKGRYHEHEYTKKELLDTFAEFKPKYFVINSTEFGKPIQFHGVEIKK